MTLEEEVKKAKDLIDANLKELNENLAADIKELEVMNKKSKRRLIALSVFGVIWCSACVTWNLHDIFWKGKTIAIVFLMLNSLALGANLILFLNNTFELKMKKKYYETTRNI